MAPAVAIQRGVGPGWAVQLASQSTSGKSSSTSAPGTIGTGMDSDFRQPREPEPRPRVAKSRVDSDGGRVEPDGRGDARQVLVRRARDPGEHTPRARSGAGRSLASGRGSGSQPTGAVTGP